MLDLVFEGGAVKALAYLGALAELESVDYALRRVVGTSAGAIVALLAALDYRSTEIGELFGGDDALLASFFDAPREFDKATVEQSLLWQAFREIDLPLVPDAVEARLDRLLFRQLCKSEGFRQAFSFVERGGLFEGHAMLEWLRRAIAAKGLPPDATLLQLHERTGVELTLVALDTTAQRRLVLNSRSAPSLPAVWAVRASASLPFVFQETLWQAAWGPYCGENLVGHAIVDGGVCSNFALDLLLSESPEMGAPPLDGYALGFLLDEDAAVPGFGPPPPPALQLRTLDRLLRLADAVMSSSDRAAIARWPERVCRLPCRGVGTLETQLGADKRELLIKAARHATHAFLKRCPIKEFA
jgi:predicted acylesterase/phospholipase RssA